jgi:biopolymer transport protein ExbB/TolQ
MDPVAVQTEAPHWRPLIFRSGRFLSAPILSCKLVMIGLIGASVWSWSIIIEKTLLFRHINRVSGSMSLISAFLVGRDLQNIYRSAVRASHIATPSIRSMPRCENRLP